MVWGDHTKRQKLYVSVHGSRSDQSPSRELAEKTLRERLTEMKSTIWPLRPPRRLPGLNCYRPHFPWVIQLVLVGSWLQKARTPPVELLSLQERDLVHRGVVAQLGVFVSKYAMGCRKIYWDHPFQPMLADPMQGVHCNGFSGGLQEHRANLAAPSILHQGSCEWIPLRHAGLTDLVYQMGC
jgi:hypothetical protein